MNTRIFLVLAGIFILLASSAGAQVDSAYFGRSPHIIVSMTKQEPDPIEPGKITEVSFKLDNNGTSAEDVTFEILPQYPFSLLPGESASVFVGGLGNSQYGRSSFTAKYKLKVADDAPDGSQEIKARYKSDNFDSWAALDGFFIKVQTHDAIMSIGNFYTTPAVIAPGEKTKLTLVLSNYAKSSLKDIKVSLGLDSSAVPMPFAPVGSTNEKVITSMEPLSEIPIDFGLLVDSDAVSKSYRVPVTVKYSDSLNKNYSKTNLVTIVVGDKPDLGIALERTDVYTSGTTGSVVLRFVNKGSPDIKFLNVKVLPNENVKVVGADEAYIGKLDSDDFSTAEFKLYLSGKSSVKIPVKVEYRDTNNNEYSQTQEVELKLYSSSEAKLFGLEKTSSLAWIVAIAVLAIVCYYFYRRRKSKK